MRSGFARFANHRAASTVAQAWSTWNGWLAFCMERLKPLPGKEFGAAADDRHPGPRGRTGVAPTWGI